MGDNFLSLHPRKAGIEKHQLNFARAGQHGLGQSFFGDRFSPALTVLENDLVVFRAMSTEMNHAWSTFIDSLEYIHWLNCPSAFQAHRIPMLGLTDHFTYRASLWSVDFMSDALACGRRFRTFNVVDDFNREALHIEVDTSINSGRLVRIFEQLKCDHGLPQVLRSDNGPEFLGEAFTAWAKANAVAIRYIQPGKPNQNAYIERFNRTFREEVLDPHLFARLDDVREAAHWWMIEYNELRPHDSLGDQTPAEVRQRSARGSTSELCA